MTDTVFSVRINGGQERKFTANTGLYGYAALQAILADSDLLPVPDEENAHHVEIWSPDLLHNYGPFNYLIFENEFGHIVTAHAVRRA